MSETKTHKVEWFLIIFPESLYACWFQCNMSPSAASGLVTFCLFSRGEWIGWLCIQGDTTAALTINKVMTRNTHHHPLLATNHTDGAKTYFVCIAEQELLSSTCSEYRDLCRTTQTNRTPNAEQATCVLHKYPFWLLLSESSLLCGQNWMAQTGCETSIYKRGLKIFVDFCMMMQTTNVEVTRPLSTLEVCSLYM